jgi:Recombinase
MFGLSQLVRVAPLLDVHRERHRERPYERPRTPLSHTAMDTAPSMPEHRERPPGEHRERPPLPEDERQLTSTSLALVDTLRTQLDTMRHELEAARVERQAAREERAMLLQMLQDMQHRYDRLLEAPRPRLEPRTPPPQAVPPVPQDPVLTQILRWRQEGMSLRAIAARLNAEGVPTRSGKGRWYQSNLSRELRRVGRVR